MSIVVYYHKNKENINKIKKLIFTK